MWLLQFVLLAAALQQTPQPGALEGTVTRMGATPVPLAGVRVRAELMVPGARFRNGNVSEAVTDGAGNFSFPELAPGRYLVQASADGYGVRTSLFSALTPQVVTINVEAGTRVKAPPLALMAAATIRGRVLDKDERPMAAVTVEFLRLTRDELGRRMWRTIPGEIDPISNRIFPVRTDVNGEFKNSLLGPGDYYVRAVLNPSDSFPLNVYHPSTTETQRAAPIVVTEGAILAADIRVGDALEHPAFRISGRIDRPALKGDPLLTNLTLVERQLPDAIVSPSPPSTVRDITDPSGKFEFLRIPQGHYDLLASLVIDGRQHTARAPLEIRDQDIEDVVLTLRPDLDLNGRLVLGADVKDVLLARRRSLATQEPAGSRAGDVLITLEGEDGIATPAMIDETGTNFSFSAVPEGRYKIVPTIVADGQASNPDLYIADIRAGGRSVFDSGLQVGADAVDALEVIVETGGGSIEGRVQGTSAVVAAMILAPESSRRNNRSLYRVTYLPRNGSFKLTGLAPGIYKIFAVPYLNETVPYLSPEFMARHEPSATTVTVTRGTAVGGVRVPFLNLGR